MANIIQQLEDLKEWSQNSERYERRLAFRGSMGTEAGTIPPEFDELSDREIEYYRKGPWSTREDYSKGQLVQPGPGRPGYSGEPWRIKQQAKNIKAQKDTWNKIGDAMWKANETGDMEFLMNKGSHKKGMMDGSMRNSWQKLSTNEDGLRHIAKEFNMDVDRVLDLMEEKKDFDIESTRLTFQEKILAKSSKLRSQFAKGEKWMMANGHRFNDPAKFKAAYIKRFGNGNAFIKAIKTGKASLFSPKFNAELLGVEGMLGQGSKLTKTLGDNIFSSVIYNMNDKVRNAITTEFERALTGDVPTVKYQARKILTQSPLLKKFGLDKKIHGPISRLIFKEIGDKMYENIQTFRQPRTTTLGLLKYLEDVVDPKYKSAISEARKAADYATRNKWKDAKKALNISDKINWDHKVPSFLIDAGYADKLEYAKLQPTTENFNMKIKNAQFDRPMANLMEEWKKAPASQKGNVITKMQDLKNNFSRKYGGYMRDVTIAPDKTGKPIFTSQAGPFTKKTDVVKSLKTSLAQEKGFKSWRAKVNAGKAATLAKALELKGIKICQKGIVKKESGGRIGFAGKCGTALAADNPNLYMKLAKESTQAQDLFKSGKIGKYLRGAKSWTLANMGPAGWIGGELLLIGLGGAYEMTQGKGWKEALDTWTGLGGHFGMSEKRLKEIGKEQGWSDQQVYDAMKIQKLLALSQEGGEKEWELEGLLEQQDIGGTARVKYDRKQPGAYKPTQGQYQDPQYLRDLKEEVPGIWEEGDALYKSLMNPQTSSVLVQELQDRKKYEELVKKNKIWGALKKRPFVGQQLEAPDPSDPGPFERSPGHPGYTGAFTKWKPDFYADGGIAGIRRPGYGGGKLVMEGLEWLAKRLKGAGKKKDLYKDIDMKKLMKGDKPIKVYSGSTIRQTNTPKHFSDLAEKLGTTPEIIAKDQFKDQWFTPFESYAKGFTDPKDITSKMRTVELDPKEVAIAKRYVEKINKKHQLASMRKKLKIDKGPLHSVTTDENLVLIPRYKLKELEKSGRMKKDYMILEKLKKKMGLAEGGLTNIRRPWAIPPESGPDPQGIIPRPGYGLGDIVKKHIPAEYRLYAKSILPGGESGKVGSDYFTEDFKQDLRRQALEKYTRTGELTGHVEELDQHRGVSSINKLTGFPSTYASLGTYTYDVDPETLDVNITDRYDWNPHYGTTKVGDEDFTGWLGDQPDVEQGDVDLSLMKDYVVNAVKNKKIDKAAGLELIGNYFGGKASEGKGFDIDIDIPIQEATPATEGSFAGGGLASLNNYATKRTG